ncbi:MAG: LytTR family DNA-binding domain-containing protein [Lachnospiraceae bacterium]|nr:response regulator transcription factor [Lachnospiraceae bacterium]
MYRVAVCDDNNADADYTAKLIEKWADSHNAAVDIELFPSAEAFLFRYAEDRTFDMLFLDIEMREMSGMELAAKIRESNQYVQIVFITGYMEYISEGYDVEALHYLLKPVTGDKLGAVLNRAVQRVRGRENTLCLQTTDGSVRIQAGEIRYIEVRRNYVTIHGAEMYTAKKTLAELEKSLDKRFFRTGRSFIVNLSYVRKITRTQVILKDGTQVPLSRGLYDDMNRAMIRYF